MKNKMLAVGAAVLLVSGIAFGYTHIRNGQCCDAKANTCNGAACPAGQQAAHCCEGGTCIAK